MRRRLALLVVLALLLSLSGAAAAQGNGTSTTTGPLDGTDGNATTTTPALIDGGTMPWWGFLLVMVVLVILASLLMQRLWNVPEQNPRAEMELMEHLQELQHRLITVLTAWGFLVLFFFSFGPGTVEVSGRTIPSPVPTIHGSFSAHVLDHLRTVFMPEGVQLVVLGPTEAVLAQLQVTAFIALLAASPLITHQIGAFLAPGLLENERRFLLRTLPLVTILFVLGSAFAYALMIPITMEVLYGYAQAIGAVELLTLPELVSFVIVLMVLFGIAFELPVIMVALVELELATSDTYIEYWRHAVVVIAILAAAISDPSIVSQLLVAGPVVGLYLLGILASKWAEGRKDRPHLPS